MCLICVRDWSGNPFFFWANPLFCVHLYGNYCDAHFKVYETNTHREQVELLEKDYLEILKAEGNLLVK